MNLAIDIGNTRIKWALFDQNRMTEHGTAQSGQLAQVCHSHNWQHGILCATGAYDLSPLGSIAERLHILTSRSRLPIALDYATPHTLGPDRIAAACGAWQAFPRQNCLVVDAGTCITIDFIDSTATYRGGAILPGIAMKFQALHTFTAKLPLLENIDAQSDILTGRSTHESILAGVLTATRLAVQGFVCRYREAYGDIQVLLTGGDAEPLWGEGLLAIDNCTIHPWLVMNGLNEIINANEK